MRRLVSFVLAICVTALIGSGALAQQPASPPAPPPYGPPITIEQAKKVAAAALAEAKKTPYEYAFAIVNPSGNLVYFEPAILTWQHCIPVSSPPPGAFRSWSTARLLARSGSVVRRLA